MMFWLKLPVKIFLVVVWLVLIVLFCMPLLQDQWLWLDDDMGDFNEAVNEGLLETDAHGQRVVPQEFVEPALQFDEQRLKLLREQDPDASR
ncbi:hypothetical protein EDC56_2363 [Sinobacterium caligoides]|uniref:Uncharacterized protein n=1 Tax=Sinobacterium caligoides TaxID=933926 RepID=A0A3N2DQ07_9GAMM|nr:hypothetical protein [Sinobacterium caligoides]ROS01914.1 hypothetical protein EDC56_2363 [Sinobacterium caligoides]